VEGRADPDTSIVIDVTPSRPASFMSASASIYNREVLQSSYTVTGWSQALQENNTTRFFNKRMYITKMKLNSTKQINTTHPNTTTSQCKKGKKKKSHVTNTHAWVVLSITAASPE